MDVYDALADPLRRQILEVLVSQRLPAGVVAQTFDHVSRPAVSRHLRVLREAGLVRAELVGRTRVYQADTTPLDEIGAWVAEMRAQRLDRQLDALETEVHRTRRERTRRQTEGDRTDRGDREETA